MGKPGLYTTAARAQNRHSANLPPESGAFAAGSGHDRVSFSAICASDRRRAFADSRRAPIRRRDAFAAIGLDQLAANFQKLFEQGRFGAAVGFGVGHAADDDA